RTTTCRSCKNKNSPQRHKEHKESRKLHMNRGFLCAFFVFFVPLWCISGGEPNPSQFILETADHEPTKGPLVSLSQDWSVRLGGPEEVRAAGAHVIALRRIGVLMPPLPSTNFILFGNGDALPFSRVRFVDERLVVTPRLGETKEIRISPSHVAVVWLAAPE